MKKAQVLSAIALAFALGIVAPVAGVSALTLEEKNAGGEVTVHGKATCAEARTAVKYVEENTDYKNILNFYRASEAAFKLKGDAFLDGNEYSVILITAAEMNAMLNSIGGAINPTIAGTPTQIVVDTKVTDTWTDVHTHLTIENVDAFIAAVKDDDEYKVLRALYDAVEANNPTAFAQAVDKYNKRYTGANLSANSDNLEAFRNNRAAIVGGGAKIAQYANYEDLFKIVDRAEKEVSGYKQAKKLILDAYKVLDDNEQILAAGKTTYRAEVTDSDWVFLDNVIDIVIDSDTLDDVPAHEFYYKGGLKISATVQDATNWNDVTAQIAQVMTRTKYSNEDDVYTDLAGLAGLYRKTLKQDIALGTLITTMVNYKPQTPVVVPETPEKDPSLDAPASGVLGSAEGSATTISIVAGLATALTALGAGVVAYRNARREK